MCTAAGVKLVYLPPYSPDLNPIEEYFWELKAFIRRNWVRYEENQNKGFKPSSTSVLRLLELENKVLWVILDILALICRFIIQQ
jgi:transposase